MEERGFWVVQTVQDGERRGLPRLVAAATGEAMVAAEADVHGRTTVKLCDVKTTVGEAFERAEAESAARSAEAAERQAVQERHQLEEAAKRQGCTVEELPGNGAAMKQRMREEHFEQVLRERAARESVEGPQREAAEAHLAQVAQEQAEARAADAEFERELAEYAAKRVVQ